MPNPLVRGVFTEDPKVGALFAVAWKVEVEGFANGFIFVVEAERLFEPNEEAPNPDVLGLPNCEEAGAPNEDMVLVFCPFENEFVDALESPLTFPNIEFEDVIIWRGTDAWGSADESLLEGGLTLSCDRGEVKRTCFCTTRPLCFA